MNAALNRPIRRFIACALLLSSGDAMFLFLLTHSRLFMTLRKISGFLCFALAAQTALAAETGRIEGHAKPGEQIVVINDKTGAISGVVADGEGHFEAGKLAPGPYQVVYQGVPRRSSGAPVIAGRTTVVKEPAQVQVQASH